MIGKTISHYRILKKIGEGGMGVVYKAKDTVLDRTVALKFLPEHLASDEEAKTRFLHEAKAASALDHPNIATIYETDEAQGRSFISMAYIDGRSLKSLLGDKTLAIDEVLDIALQIAEGLNEAHRHGVVHRDIKSDNIMLTTRDVVKIMDFGLAKVRGVSRVTKLGTTLGTLAYMSPEQAKGVEADNRSDIFSFGVVLYEMVTGELPFTAEHEAALLYSIINTEPRPVRDLRRDVPPELVGIIGKAMEKDPNGRYQDAEELLIDLRRARSRLPSKGVLQGTKPLGIPPRSRRRILIPAVVLVVVAVGLLISIKIQVGRQPPAEAAANVLAVMYFENMAGREDPGRLGRMVTNLIIADLSESRYMQVLSAQRLHDILRLVDKEGKRAIDEDVASQVARRANARWMLTGSIMRAEPRIIVVAQLVEVAGGKVIASQRVEGHEGEDIFSVVDRLTAELKGDLSLPAAAMRESDPRVADVTTHSSEAYRYYLEGLDYIDKTYYWDAERRFEKALKADSTFAMAYYHLAGIRKGVEGRELIAKALKYSDSVSKKERQYIKSLQAALYGDYDRCIKELSEIVRRYPDEKDAHFELGNVFSQLLGDDEQAIGHYLKVIEMDPLHKTAYNQLAYTYDNISDLDRSIWAINKYISLAPDEANPYDTRGELYAFNGRLDEAIESFKTAIDKKPDFYPALRDLGMAYMFKRDYEKAERTFGGFFTSGNKEVRSTGRVLLALIPQHQGMLDDALKKLDDGIAADEMEEYQGRAYVLKRFIKAFIYNYRRESELALREADTWMEMNPTADPNDVVNMRHFHIRILAENGMVDKAERIARVLKSDIEARDPTEMEYYWLALSFIERARGNKRGELNYLRKSLETTGPGFPPQFFLGRCLLESGKLGEAVDVLKNAASRYERLRAILSIWSVEVHYYLGLAYEESGWTDEAIGQYEEFLKIWRDADPGIAAVEDAKERLARLGSQS